MFEGHVENSQLEIRKWKMRWKLLFRDIGLYRVVKGHFGLYIGAIL